MAGSPLKRARRNAQLAAQFAPIPDAIPMSEASQELRDARAAMSVLLSPLDPHSALVDLLPEAAQMNDGQRRKLRHQTTQSERVRAILRNDLSELERHRRRLIARMVRVALNEDDPDSAIRAFSQLAKVAGWTATVKLETTGPSFNVHSMLSDPNSVRAALALMSHDAGGDYDAQRVLGDDE